MILLVNVCVRRSSRTKMIADHLLSETKDRIVELDLSDVSFPTVDESFLAHRDELIANGNFEHQVFNLARQFAAADQIVIAAPCWDLSFPATLKQYLELINVIGITFRYTAEGIPMGLCKASKLYYVTTAGGTFVPEEYGYGYVKALAENFYGIPEVGLVKAVGLDIDGADEDQIIKECMSNLQPLQ